MVGAIDTICLQQTEVFSQPKLRPAIAENPSAENLAGISLGNAKRARQIA
jgi:hypothetical protein